MIELEIVTGLITAIAAAGGAWAAVRAELKYLRRDVDEISNRVTRLERRK